MAMNKAIAFLLAFFACCCRQAWADEGEAFVSNVDVAIVADGAQVCEGFDVGYASDAQSPAVVVIDGTEAVRVSDVGSFAWQPKTAGVHSLVHSVGDVLLAMSCVVTKSGSESASSDGSGSGDGDEATASASGVNVMIVADGAHVGEGFDVGYASDAQDPVVVAIDGTEAVRILDVGSFAWQPKTAGVHSLVHSVGDVLLAMSCVVTKSVPESASSEDAESDDADEAMASTSNVDVTIIADGAHVNEGFMVGYAPTTADRASVMIDGQEVVRSSFCGSFAWQTDTEGVHSLVHSVGDIVLAMRCVVVNGGVVATADEQSDAEASVSIEVLEEGGVIDGTGNGMAIGYAPDGNQNAVVTINGDVFVDARESGMKQWRPQGRGRQSFVHTVGDISLLTTYVVASWMPEDPVPDALTDADVAAALGEMKDAGLVARLRNVALYQKYRDWIGNTRVAGTDLEDASVLAKRQAIKSAPYSWLAYALDLDYDAAVKLAPKQGDLVIATFANDSLLTVLLDGVSVGANATAENLAEAFVVEGATTLDDAAFSSSSVNATFAPTIDGRVSIAIKPTDATTRTFFIRVRLMP